MLALGSNKGLIYLIDISDPDNPTLLGTIDNPGGSYIRDVAFDAAGNLYTVSNSSETLRIYSPGGDWETLLGSDGTFSATIVPEPSMLSLLALGGLALVLRRRR